MGKYPNSSAMIAIGGAAFVFEGLLRRIKGILLVTTDFWNICRREISLFDNDDGGKLLSVSSFDDSFAVLVVVLLDDGAGTCRLLLLIGENPTTSLMQVKATITRRIVNNWQDFIAAIYRVISVEVI